MSMSTVSDWPDDADGSSRRHRRGPVLGTPVTPTAFDEVGVIEPDSACPALRFGRGNFEASADFGNRTAFDDRTGIEFGPVLTDHRSLPRGQDRGGRRYLGVGAASVGDPPDDELTVGFLIEDGTSRLAYAYTIGLWCEGVPELYLGVPPDFNGHREHDWGRVGLFFALGLMHLANGLIAADDLEIAPYAGELDGQPVSLWLAGQEPAEGPLALVLDDQVDTVLRVHCSLWQPPAQAGDQAHDARRGRRSGRGEPGP